MICSITNKIKMTSQFRYDIMRIRVASSVVERYPHTIEVAGSIPAPPTNLQPTS